MVNSQGKLLRITLFFEERNMHQISGQLPGHGMVAFDLGKNFTDHVTLVLCGVFRISKAIVQRH